MDKLFNRSLLVFTNDLRLDDNPTLLAAAKQSEEFGCVFIDDHAESQHSNFGINGYGAHRKRFLAESLDELNKLLKQRGQFLVYEEGGITAKISELIRTNNVEAVFYSIHAGLDERRKWQHLMVTHPDVSFIAHHSYTLFEQQQLDFSDGFPTTFSKFRRLAEKLSVTDALKAPSTLPSSFLQVHQHKVVKPVTTQHSELTITGGENSAFTHLDNYFNSSHAQHYKQSRNALDGWHDSTKFSPWLANGSLSARRVINALKAHEENQGANESTYWIYFELLWREYFQWYAHAHNEEMFRFKGLANEKPLTTFYPERFRKWVAGQTPYPLVNACMNQLAQTGYMSNRGRQIVASCLVNELAVDWRAGAAYFEQQLIDYDVASNWGNWQYIAGVGADPKGGRHFNIQKQTDIYDPDGRFVSKWTSGPPPAQLDSVDAADWPIV